MRILKIIALALLIVSCKSTPQEAKKLPELLYSITSDALTIRYSSSCSDIVNSLQDDSPFTKINYSGLQHSPSILSKSYIGTLSSTLSIAFKPGQEGVANEIARKAAELKLKSTLLKGRHSSTIPSNGSKSETIFLILSTSDAQINSIKRHYQEGSSILDAPAFLQAAKAANGDNWDIYRCNSSRRYVPQSFLQGIFSHRTVTNFIDQVADWLVLNPIDNNCSQLIPINASDSFCYSDMLASLPLADCKLGSVIPDSCDFALSLPVIQPQTREQFEHWQDARIKLNTYNQRLSSLKSKSGKHPKAWEKECELSELALIVKGDERILLLRTGKKEVKIEPNLYQGFAAALFGTAFALEDETWAADTLGWKAIGSQTAVDAYLRAEKPLKEPIWPTKKSHFLMRYSGYTLEWTKNGILLWNLGL